MLFRDVYNLHLIMNSSSISYQILEEFGIEPSGSMKCWGTIEWPNI
jgi:hypothetical protein